MEAVSRWRRRKGGDVVVQTQGRSRLSLPRPPPMTTSFMLTPCGVATNCVSGVGGGRGTFLAIALQGRRDHQLSRPCGRSKARACVHVCMRA